MGTDQYGRDVLARVVDAARLDLRIAFSITLLALVVGSLIGGGDRLLRRHASRTS